MVSVPRLVIAAPASSQGKTTVATGLLHAMSAAGLAAAGFKVGPDYIDPTYHALACGRPGRNLDPVLVGEELIGPLFAHGAAGADIAVIEGVMGLFDGRVGAGEHGSTAQVAKLLDAPVLLVVDVAAQGRSVAALLHGFRTFGDVRLSGVILNRVGSPRHEELLREACEEVGVPVLGALHRAGQVSVPSRHLGLIPAAERHVEARDAVAAMGQLVAASVDVAAVVDVARSAAALHVSAWSPSTAVAALDRTVGSPTVARDRPVIAVAGGPAFTFGYVEQSELLAAAGAEVVTFDPLHDEALPLGTAGLVIGGGFPEVYAEQLSANEPLREAIRKLGVSGAPIAAECAGLLWLAQDLDGHPMCGLLDARAAMTQTLTIGYRDAVALTPSLLGPAGTRVTGHEFHRTAVTPAAGDQAAWAWRGATEGFVQGGVHASYLHLHWAGLPSAACSLVEAACG